ncbi:hypothetical protein FQZ97_1217110 [compost metagenome]
MGHIDHGCPEIIVQLGQFHPHVDSQRRIEIGKRLVEQEDPGFADNGAADGHALALSA